MIFDPFQVYWTTVDVDFLAILLLLGRQVEVEGFNEEGRAVSFDAKGWQVGFGRGPSIEGRRSLWAIYDM